MSNTTMWFDGPVAEAVSLVNAKNCVFIVYIFDESDNSQKLDATLNAETVMEKITANAVALKMHKDSDNAKLFQQLYPMPHIPILYFIKQGTIKEFGTQDITEEEIITKIDQASAAITTSTTAVASQQQQSSSSSSSSPVPSPAVSTMPTPVAATTTISPQSSTNNNSESVNAVAAGSSSSPDKSARKEKLRKQMEEARKKREEREKQEAREREIKRREDGKGMQQTRQQMEDQRNKQYFAKIKKEKKEEEEHRRKIKEQIARDRAEQIAARQAERKKRESENNESPSSPSPSSSPPTQQQRHKSPSSGQHHDSSSISIRQLDGSSIRNKFQATDTLTVVKDWIDQNRTDGDQPYKLLAQFPTRQFSIGDEEKSLRELELCPSATIIMKGIKNVSHAYGAGTNGSYMDYVYSAGGMLYNAASTVGSTMSGVVYSLFPAEPAASSGTATGTLGQNVIGGYPSNNNSATSTSSRSIPNPLSYGGQRLGGDSSMAGPRSNGSNVNTLRSSEFDDDDDGRTYNGNSLNQE